MTSPVPRTGTIGVPDIRTASGHLATGQLTGSHTTGRPAQRVIIIGEEATTAELVPPPAARPAPHRKLGRDRRGPRPDQASGGVGVPPVPAPEPAMTSGQFIHRDTSGTETDVTTDVGCLYDLVIGSMDWGSGFLTVEDAEPVVRIARLGQGIRRQPGAFRRTERVPGQALQHAHPFGVPVPGDPGPGRGDRAPVRGREDRA